MSKTLKIILSIVAVIVVVLGILYITGRIVLNNQPDSSGWDRKVLKGDTFEAFFPRTLGTDLYYIGPYQGGKFDAIDPMGDVKNIDTILYNDNFTMNSGFNALASRSTYYASKRLDSAPIFRMWTEQLSPDEYTKYKANIIDKELKSYDSEAGIELEKIEYNNHEYYLYLRNDLSYEKVKGNNSLGGAYIFFPEKNTSVFIMLFNTRYDTPNKNNYIISKEEFVNVIQEIIDSATK